MDSKGIQRYGFALLAWTIAWATMFALEQKLDLANLAMLMVLASALSAIWPVPKRFRMSRRPSIGGRK
jgi:two-component system sensor histidine kinase KdpD